MAQRRHVTAVAGLAACALSLGLGLPGRATGATLPSALPRAAKAAAASHQTPGRHRAPRARHRGSGGVPGVPLGAPRAALRPEPALPRPSRRQWPFPDAFARTSGTGRLAGGASLWTDFLFDDHGATAPTGAPVSPAALDSSLAPTQGVAAYPSGPARNNGADIFRAAVGLTRKASYWRVDWTTFVKPGVPIAEWTFDTDDNARTGSSRWPAQAGVTSPGIERALVVSAKGAELVNTKTGTRVNVAAHGGRLAVNRGVRSFIVRIPRKLLPVGGRWRIRLASGLASANGRTFAQPDYSSSLDLAAGAQNKLPHVFNVTFRTRRQEPPIYRAGVTDAQEQQFATTTAGTPINKALGVNGLSRFVTGNFWMEDDQADVLGNGGNVSRFARTISWSRLRHHATTPQPRPRGYSNRWYVSRLHLGQGVIANPTTSPNGDLLPNYLSRVQPYTVYVPRHVSLAKQTPLTWVLHSLGVNLNQYGALDPHLLQQECQARRSICATTEGLGPDGWYFDKSEADFWAVWHALATSYRLDPRRTVISGYSMGGWASYKLGLAHPDLFSQAMPLEGPPDCGVRLLELNGQQVEEPAGSGKTGHCSADGFTTPLLGNALWLPYDVTQGGLDELVPAPSNLQTTDTMRKLGERYTLFFLPADDHLVYATQDRFGGIVKQLGRRIPAATRNPALIHYSWYPNLDSRHLGIGATTAYWVTHMRAGSSKPGVVASLSAQSAAIRDRAVTLVDSGPTLVTTPPPASRTTQQWRLGARPAARDRLTLHLTKVAELTIDAARARLSCPRVVVSSTRPVRVRLTHLKRGSVSLSLPAGRSSRRVACS